MSDTFLGGIGGFAVGMLSTALLFGALTKHTVFYKTGVRDTHKEAFENGLMTKSIDKDDKVIYNWIELHDKGYDGE